MEAHYYRAQRDYPEYREKNPLPKDYNNVVFTLRKHMNDDALVRFLIKESKNPGKRHNAIKTLHMLLDHWALDQKKLEDVKKMLQKSKAATDADLMKVFTIYEAMYRQYEKAFKRTAARQRKQRRKKTSQ